MGTVACALCYDSQDNRVSCADEGNSMIAIDGATDSVVRVISSGCRGPSAACYDEQSNDVFCSDTSSNIVAVIDAASYRVRATIPVGIMPSTLCCNSLTDRVYCANQGGCSISILKDSLHAGIGERGAPYAIRPASCAGPTIIQDVLEMPAASSLKLQASSYLLNVAGREVLKLHAGPNDVSRLAPGVYFIRQAVGCQPSAACREPSAARKVVIQN